MAQDQDEPAGRGSRIGEAPTSLNRTAGIPSASRFVPSHGPPETLADLQRLAYTIPECQQIARKFAVNGSAGQSEMASIAIPEAYAARGMSLFCRSNLSFLLDGYQRVSKASATSMAVISQGTGLDDDAMFDCRRGLVRRGPRA